MNVPVYIFSQFYIDEHLVVSFFHQCLVHILLLLKSKVLSLQILVGVTLKIVNNR